MSTTNHALIILWNGKDMPDHVVTEIVQYMHSAGVSIPELTKAIYKNSEAPLAEAEKIMRPLAEAFEEVARADDSKSVMKNSESIVAGYTYGRSDVNEMAAYYDKNRGFLA